MTRQLEIGPGERRLPGEWTTLDCVARPGVVDQVSRWGAEPLPFPDESFELVYAAHVLEHVPWYQTVAALLEAARVLAPGGRLELHVPDLAVLVRAIDAQCCLDSHVEPDLNQELHWMHWAAERLFHGGPEEAWHRACFNAPHLRWCLERAGFVELEPLDHERGSDHGVINLGLSARKPTAVERSTPSSRVTRQEFRPNSQVSSSLAGVSRENFLPACHSRHEYAPDQGVFFCTHPQVHVAQHLVSREICARCDRWREAAPEGARPFRSELGALHEGPCWHLGAPIGWRPCASCRGKVRLKVLECQHPDHASTTAQACLVCPDYEQRLRRGAISQWAVGLTTAPRAPGTLSATLSSLAAAGWTDVRIFAEPDSPLPDDVAPQAVTQRATTLGAWPNFYLGLAELCQRQPFAEAYLMVQDDVQFCRNLRGYLEHVLWPAEKLGVVVLRRVATSEFSRGFQPTENWPPS